MKKYYPIVLFFLTMPVFTSAQKIEYPVSFLQLLEQVGIDFFEPVEAGYKDVRLNENPYQNYQFAIKSNKEDLEIRYFILPFDETNVQSINPHLQTMRTITSIASNEEEADISAIQPDANALHEDFNADWGMVYFFKPKIGFADYPSCRMMSLYKEGKGLVFIFHLFKKPENEALDTRYYALRFLENGANY